MVAYVFLLLVQVRADVERKAAARIQSMARMKQGKAIAKTMNDLRAKLRHAMSYTGDNQDEVHVGLYGARSSLKRRLKSSLR